MADTFDVDRTIRRRHRLIELSNAVIAFAITLLVLNVSLPALRSGQSLTDAVGDLGPEVFAWLLSFIVIAVQWHEHDEVFDQVVGADAAVTAANFAFLALIATLPFTSDLLGRHGNQTLATALYAANIAALIASLLLIEVAADRRGLRRKGAGRVGGYDVWVPLVCFTASIPIAYVNPTIAKFVWALSLTAEPIELLSTRRTARRAMPDGADGGPPA
jgi:uncharacterized membrane protein